jgi:hypothetical protein
MIFAARGFSPFTCARADALPGVVVGRRRAIPRTTEGAAHTQTKGTRMTDETQRATKSEEELLRLPEQIEAGGSYRTL